MVAMNLNGDVMCKRLYTVAYMRWFNHDDGPVSHETLTEYERKIPLP